MNHSNSMGLLEGNPLSTGVTCGFILDDSDHTLFFADDTGICTNLKVVGEVYDPDIAILPISGGFVMDPEEAAIAADWTNADTVIPMPYDSIDEIPEVDPQTFTDAVNNRTPETSVKLLAQGESIEV